MATIPVVLQTLNISHGGNTVQAAFEEEDISFGDAKTKDFSINSNGNIDDFNIKKPSITFTARGLTGTSLVTLQERRKEIMLNLMDSIVESQDITFGAYVIPSCYLAQISPSAPLLVNNKSVYPQIELVYNSREYE